MKILVLLSLLVVSPVLKAEEHAYWVESSVCGEMDPYLVGDACLVEVANQDEHFYVLIDSDHVAQQIGDLEELAEYDVVLEKSALTELSAEQLAVLSSHMGKQVAVFGIDSKDVEITQLQHDDN